jgi:hypothetical protein
VVARVTVEEVIARCVASGRSSSDCEALAYDHMVNGVYCDGTIVIDASGKRCVSRALAARVAAARADQPLRREVEMVRPREDATPAERWIVLAVGALLAAGLVWTIRKG